MRRIVALLLALLLFSSMCIAAAAETDPKYAEPMIIHNATIQIVEGADYNADALTTFVRDKFNITWEIIPLTWDSWAEKLRIWINTGDMPDMATWDYLHGEALNYAEQGLVRRFPDDWKERWPNVAAAYDNSQLGPALDEMLGGTYFLPKPIFSTNKPTDPLVNHMVLGLRKDWLIAVGAEVKDCYTVNEIMEIARLFKEQDPGNVGSKLYPINMALRFAQGAFIGTSNTEAANFVKNADGEYIWGPAMEETLAGLKLYQQVFREELINPEFFTVKDGEDIASFCASGQTGIYFSEGQAFNFLTAEQDIEKNLGLNGRDTLHIAYLLGNDGRYYGREQANYWTTTIFSPTMEDAKFERIMDVMDYVASDEGQLLVRLGFEGIDYVVEEDGSYTVLWEEGQQITDAYPSVHPLYGDMVILTDDFAIINPSFDPYLRDLVLRMYHGKAAHMDEISVPRIDWDLYFHDSPNYRMVGFDFGKEYTQLITMDGDLETNWRNWIAAKAPLVDPVLQELNEMAKAK